MAKAPEGNTGEVGEFQALVGGSRIATTIKSVLSLPKSAKGKDLIDACGKGNLEVVTSLLQSGVKPDHRTTHWTPLIAASEMGHFDIVQALLAAKAQINLTSKEARTALHAASYRGHLDIVRLLLEKGASVDSVDQEGQTALHRASFAGHPDIVSLLVGSGADINKQGKDGSTPLHQSSGQGEVKIVRFLLDHKAKTSLRIKKWERTALHSASSRGQTEVVKMLLYADLGIDDRDQNHMTPLIFAAIGGHTNTVNFLAHAGADLNVQNNDGMTALIFAVKKDKFDVAEVLVHSGADVNMQEDKDNWSAIFFAVKNEKLSMVMLLCEAGADLELKDKQDRTPLKMAKRNSDIHKALLEAKTVGLESHLKSKSAKVDSPSAEQKEKKKVSCFKYSDDYPGMCFFLNPWKQTVTTEGASIRWEEIGIEFDIPQGAVPEGKSLELSVWPSTAGPFVLPEGYDLSSPVYLISPAFDFTCNITLRMYHYCNLETEQQCDSMAFISSPATPSIVQPSPRYKFKVLSKGSFLHSEAYGSIALKHFCNTAAAVKRKRSRSDAPEGGGPSTKKTKGDVSNCYNLRMYDAMENLAVFSACLNQPTYLMHPSRSGLPSPPTTDPAVPLSNPSVQDDCSRKVKADDKVDIRLLNKFPCLSHPSGYINILMQAAPHYTMVGNILLNSPDGATVRMLELRHNKDPYLITYDIFRIWLNSDERPSWTKLVQCFRDAADELNRVAKDIEDNLKETDSAADEVSSANP